MANLEDLKYPVGKFTKVSGSLGNAERAGFINDIEQTPAIIRSLVKGLTDAQLATPYRPGGWTIRQVVHHVPDSHMNAYIRFKLAVTEENPTIKPYEEARWAELVDGRSEPIAASLDLLEALHKRWVVFLRSMSAADFGRTYFHPEMKSAVTLDQALAIYGWHGKHHAAHIRQALG
jgi:DinB family protein